MIFIFLDTRARAQEVRNINLPDVELSSDSESHTFSVNISP